MARTRGKGQPKRRRDVRGKVRGSIRLLSAALAIAAVTRELRRPKSEREWHGEIAKVPYDFRAPSPRRLLRRSWAPDDPRIIVPRAFGVGWALNFAAVMKQVKRYRAKSARTRVPA
ncbi:MAG: hypothetical protein QOH29_668 [Actinomycetota bacterium]|jgi:hypothetical protein|nr:hypothetical protein [Actinomycetota bacterium]